MTSRSHRLASLYILKISPLLPSQGEQETTAQILGSELSQLNVFGMNRYHFQQWWVLWSSWQWKSWGCLAKIMESYGTKKTRDNTKRKRRFRHHSFSVLHNSEFASALICSMGSFNEKRVFLCFCLVTPKALLSLNEKNLETSLQSRACFLKWSMMAGKLTGWEFPTCWIPELQVPAVWTCADSLLVERHCQMHNCCAGMQRNLLCSFIPVSTSPNSSYNYSIRKTFFFFLCRGRTVQLGKEADNKSIDDQKKYKKRNQINICFSKNIKLPSPSNSW